MDKLEALTALRDKVRAGSFPADMSARDMGLTANYDGLPIINTMYSAFGGSLDAAKALHDAVLPCVDVDINIRLVLCDVTAFIDEPENVTQIYSGTDENPARAWLIAVLEALIAQEPKS
jgi:hypothetical protein